MRWLVLSSLFVVSLGASPAGADEAARLHDLFAREWEARLQSSPMFATSVGRHEWNDQLGSASVAAMERELVATRGFLAELERIDRGQLQGEDLVSYDIFRRQLSSRVEDAEYGDYQMPINADSGFHSGFSRLPKDVPLETPRDYDNYIARLKQWPRYVAENIDNMRAGLKRGFTVPQVTLNGSTQSIQVHVVSDPEKSVFWEPFARFPVGVPAAEHARLRQAGRAAIQDAVVPGYRSFLEFMEREYIPGARQSLGASELPNGAAYYRFRIRQFTSLDLTPAEIHQIGLAEVARIEAEMRAVIKQVGFQGDFAAFLQFLRTDPRFYPKTAEELLKEASYIAKRMDGKLPALFKRIPRLPYTIEPVPADIAPKYTAGRYVDAPAGSTRPGTYWVNTYNLPSRALYNLEALTFHEAVPGHHLQISLNQELEGLPEFRRHSYISAFGEGWGLYSEWLGLEAGFYTDPYSNFGRLTYEMWRACRLVVDTGLHAMGWTRSQARDYLASHSALPLHEVETETDRYISWPGQALAYKLGEIKIRELRRRAEAALGTRFDVRDFHDEVLSSGSLPLAVLDQKIDRWIAAQQAKG